jgi:hypothetical protein
MNHSLNKETLVTQVNAYAAATTGAVTTAGTIIDLGSPTEGVFDSVRFILSPGIVLATGTIVMKALVGNDSALGDGVYATTQVSVLAPTPTTKSSIPVCLDVIRPGKRYVRLDYTLAAANTAINCVLAERYNAKAIPTQENSDDEISVNAL